MLVVALILVILVVAIINIFVSVVRVQRYTLAAQAMLDQVSYNMEYMSRHLRMAKKDTTGNCVGEDYNYAYPEGGNDEGIIFLNYNKECQTFIKEQGKNNLKSWKEEETQLPLFSDKFTVNSFNVNLMGHDGGEDDEKQPRATFLLDIEGDAGGFNPNMKIQTTVSQRDLDI